MTSAFSATVANARSMRSRVASDACRSPAAAIRITPACCTVGGNGNCRTVPESSFDELIDAMKASAAILQQAEVPFVLGGGLSAWARGGQKSEHDVDFLLRPQDAEQALDAFDRSGWKPKRRPDG